MGKKAVASQIWTYRKRKGFSQKRVAFLIGHKTTSQISNYERGKKMPALPNAISLGIILGVPTDFLFRDLYNKLKQEVESREGKRKQMLETE